MNPPLIHSDTVARPRLLERLERDVRRPLTLISAPAGYGKSTLVAQWLEGSSLPGVWLSLDEGDNAPRPFLAYFLAAVRRHSPNACPSTHDCIAAARFSVFATRWKVLALYFPSDAERDRFTSNSAKEAI
jgi:LuxR family maltose regulon positive regulatory protein